MLFTYARRGWLLEASYTEIPYTLLEMITMTGAARNDTYNRKELFNTHTHTHMHARMHAHAHT